MRGRRRGALAADPFLLGALTVIVIVVAIFLAYNANNGLPFVPTRELRVDIRSASDLVRGNDVRIGGFRIGAVSKIDPIVLPNGRAGARLILKLDPHDGVVPVDSRVVIRSHSALGLKYVDLIRGTASTDLADGATLPAAQARVPVQIEDVLSTFDKPTRLNVRRVLVGTGDGRLVAVDLGTESFKVLGTVGENAALEGLAVTARVLQHSRGPRIEVLRYKSKKRVRVHRGGRADYTAIEILAVGGLTKATGSEKTETTAEAKAKTETKKAKPVKASAETDEKTVGKAEAPAKGAPKKPKTDKETK